MVVNWNLGGQNGIFRIGDTSSTSNILTVSNEFITSPFLAKFVGEELLSLFGTLVKTIDIVARFRIEVELFDTFKIDIGSTILDKTKTWLVIGYDLDFDNSLISFKLMEIFNVYSIPTPIVIEVDAPSGLTSEIL